MYDFLMTIADPVGLVGVAIILVAYLLLSVGKWHANTIRFQAINFFGAWMILFSLYFHWNLSSVVIEIAWAIISVIGIYRAYLTEKKRNVTD